MSQFISFSLTFTSPATAAQKAKAEKFVQAFNKLFPHPQGGGLMDWGWTDAPDGSPRYFDLDKPCGQVKPRCFANALFLFAGLVALSRILPTAEIAVFGPGRWWRCSDYAVRSCVLRQGRATFPRGHRPGFRCGLTVAKAATQAVEPGAWVSEVNAYRAEGMKEVRLRSATGTLLASQLPALFQDVKRVVFAAMAGEPALG